MIAIKVEDNRRLALAKFVYFFFQVCQEDDAIGVRNYDNNYTKLVFWLTLCYLD